MIVQHANADLATRVRDLAADDRSAVTGASPEAGLLPGRSWPRLLYDASHDRGHHLADGLSLR